jgi:hypothetical protein
VTLFELFNGSWDAECDRCRWEDYGYRSRAEADAALEDHRRECPDDLDKCMFDTTGCCGDPAEHDYCGGCPRASAEHPDRGGRWPGVRVET